MHNTPEGWRDAILLKKGGQLLLKGEEGEPKTITITNITVETKHQTTYNLEVANAHTFFVGEDGVLVHNGGARKPWKITPNGTSRTMRHGNFGMFYKSKSDGTWWSKDNAGHGGSAWKVFKETSRCLQWVSDADEYGDYIIGKHKGDTGMTIPWSQLKGVK